MEPLEGNVSVGEILDCVVEQVMPYGAFVRILKTGRKGMIHISELAFNYVKNIGDVISVQDKVKAKVIKIDERGRVDLSIKQLSERPAAREHQPSSNRENQNREHHENRDSRENREARVNNFNHNRNNNRNFNNHNNHNRNNNNYEREREIEHEHEREREEPDTFEKKMASFMKISEAKLTDLNARNSARSGHGRKNNSNSRNTNKF